jgi:hypothetical protein
MDRLETPKAGLPVPIDNGARPSLFSRGNPKAGFISQLIAERHHLSTQRQRRQAPMEEALRTYDAGGKLSIRRLPPGYRMAVDA